MMTVALLTIGTELTRGEIVNTNATFLADRLTALGFEVTAIESIPDERTQIIETFHRLAAVHRIIIVSGGLGPTSDDCTAECAAMAAGVSLRCDNVSLEDIRAKLAKRGRELSVSNSKQADIPETAEVLPNAIGTAPGFQLRLGNAQLFFTPGVPVEMKCMFGEQIVPRIRSLSPNNTAQNHLQTFGLPESQLGDALSDIEEMFPGVVLGYRAKFPEVEVKVFARSSSQEKAQELTNAATQEVKKRIGHVIYGENRNDSYAAAVLQTLRARRLTLSIAESCTGGLVSHMLTTVAGSSESLLAGIVSYSNEAKINILGVDATLIKTQGAVSIECAQAMAKGVRAITKSDIGVSITGIAGPGGATETKPVGLVYFGIDTAAETRGFEKRFLGFERERVQTFAAYAALKLVIEAANKIR